jgi:SAM-dependent methyltransferase
VDINEASLAVARREHPELNVGWATARALPFRDGWFDLVYTVAVLMHQPDPVLPLAMHEIVRCSRRWVLCAEYYADEPTELEWRAPGALIKRDFTREYVERFPDLTLVEEGFLDSEDGFDRVNFAVFEKNEW